MACMSNKGSMTIFVAFIVALLCLTHVSSLATDPQQITSTPTTTNSQDLPVTKTVSSAGGTGHISCVTGGNGWYIDPPIVQSLSPYFCARMAKPGKMPKEGETRKLEDNEYPALLPFTDPPSPTQESINPDAPQINTSLIYTDGLVVEFLFTRRPSAIVSDTLYLHGTDEQCARDDCNDILHHSVGTCQFDSHTMTGATMALSECGLYMMFIQNCSGNYVDPSCEGWHKLWPNVGLKEDETLYWNITHGIHGDSDIKLKEENDVSIIEEPGLEGIGYLVDAAIEAGIFKVMDWIGEQSD